VFVYSCRLKLQKNCGLNSSHLTHDTETLTLFYQHWYAKTCLISHKIAPWFKRKLDNCPTIVQQTFLHLRVRIFMQIKAAKRIASCTHLSLTHDTETLTLFYEHWCAKTCLEAGRSLGASMYVQVSSHCFAKSLLLNVSSW